MKITKTEIWTVVVPTVAGRVSSEIYASHDPAEQPRHIIRLHTDDGNYGLGESPRGLPLEQLRAMAQRLEGLDPLRMIPQELPAQLGSLDRDNGGLGPDDRWWEQAAAGPTDPAYSTFEMAIFDLLGRYYGKPAHWFLGGAVRDRVLADYAIGLQTSDDARKNTYLAVTRGFRGMKLKHTAAMPIHEVCEAIWDVAGHDFALTLDPNQRFWRYTEALPVAKSLVGTGGKISSFANPLPVWNLDAYRLLRKKGIVPISLTLADPAGIIRAIKAEAVDHLGLGGSMVQFVRNAAIAHAAGIPCWHDSGVDCGIQEFANLHAAAAARNCVLGSAFSGSWMRQDDLLVEGLQFEDGYAVVPDRPGLGCELDMDAIENHRVA